MKGKGSACLHVHLHRLEKKNEKERKEKGNKKRKGREEKKRKNEKRKSEKVYYLIFFLHLLFSKDLKPIRMQFELQSHI